MAYAIEPDRIVIGIDAEGIEMPVHHAIPCGMILNELLSNALKYAFPGGREGKIKIRFSRIPAGELLLSCHDHGIGIPENIDWKNANSLGFRIVRMLTKQIDGELTLDHADGGTRF